MLCAHRLPRHPLLAVVLAAITCLLFVLPHSAHAATGDLDTSFDGDGRISLSWNSSYGAEDITVDRQGRTIMAGDEKRTCSYNRAHATLVRLDQRGVEDPTFNGDGRTAERCGLVDQRFTRVVAQPDGKYLTASSDANGYSVYLYRFTADGTPEPGKQLAHPQGTHPYWRTTDVRHLERLSDGRYIVVASINRGDDPAIGEQRRIIVWRVNADLTLDTSYGGGSGYVVLQRDATDFVDANAAVVNRDGGVVVGGYAYTSRNTSTPPQPTNPVPVLTKVTPQGALDTSFGTNGWQARSDLASIEAMGRRPDGSILLGTSASNDFQIAAISPNGSPFTSYGTNGKAQISIDANDQFRDLQVLPNGGVVAVGGIHDSNIRLAVGVLRPDGSPDTDFSGDGVMISSWDSLGHGEAAAVALDDAGRVLVGGMHSYYIGHMAAARLHGDPQWSEQLRLESLGTPRAGNTSSVGDPVNAVTGNAWETVQDLKLPGRGLPLVFARTYNSQDPMSGALGHGWTHSFTASLSEALDGAVTIREGDGARRTYDRLADGTYRALVGTHDALAKNPDGSFVLTRKNGVAWRFSSTGRLESITDLNGNELTLTYTAGRLTSVADPVGRTVTFTYDSSGRITKLTDAANREVSYAYDTAGDLTSVTDQAGAATTYTYDANHNLLTIKRPGTTANPGETTSFTYDSEDRATSTSGDSNTGKLTLTYEPEQGRTKIKDSKQNESTFSYDGAGQITKILDPKGKETSTTWDGAGNKAAVTDPLGQRTDYEHDAKGNPTKVTGPAPSAGEPRPVTEMTYGAHSRLTSAKDARGKMTTFAYDSAGNQISSTDPLSKVTSATYNAAGQPLTSTNARGKTTTFAYAADGTMASATDARGKATTFDHDALGRPLSSKDPLGRETSYAYDARDRLKKITHPPAKTGDPATTTELAYDSRGNLTSQTDERGKVTKYEYDRHNRLTATEDPTGRRTTAAYDTEGNRTAITEAAGTASASTTTLAYDELRRLIKQTQDDGAAITGDVETTYTYDAAGRPTKVTDPKSNATNLSYDALGRLTSVTDADSKTATYSYSPTGELTRTVNPNGRAVAYAYDDAGQLSTKTVERDPAPDNVWSFAYDAVGNLASKTNAEGQTTSFAYDELDQLTAEDRPGSEPDITHAYDDVGNPTSLSDGTGTSTFAYDGRDRLTQENLPGARILKHVYDAAGRRTGLELPGADNRSFEYDDAGRLTAAIDTANRRSEHSYDPAGRLAETKLPRTGAGTKYEHDPLGRITRVENNGGTGQLLSRLNYSFDKASNVTSIADDQSRNSSFSYDVLNRLTREAHQGPGASTRDYAYDAGGNRTSETVDGGTPKTYSYDDAEQLTAAGSSTFAYDRNGNQTSRTTGSETTNYAYDSESQLTGVDLPGATPDETYTYDGMGRRTSETRGAQTTSLLRDGADIVQETTGTATTRYLRGAGGLLSRDDGASGGERFYHPDGIGSPVALSDSSGAATDTSAYNAFGEERASTGTTPSPFGYLGEVANPATKLNDFHARSYSAAEGRFAGRDPVDGALAQPQSLNPYQYGFGNPHLYTDANGQSPSLSDLGGAASDTFYAVGSFGEVVDQELTPFRPTMEHYLAHRSDKAGVDWGEMARLGAVDAAFALPVGPGGSAKVWKLGAAGLIAAGRRAAEVGSRVPGLRKVGPFRRAGIVKDAGKGTGDFGLGSASSRQAERAGEKWIGEGARTASDKKTRISADGLRQFRPPTYKGRRGETQANFEQRSQPSGRWEDNGHLNIK